MNIRIGKYTAFVVPVFFAIAWLYAKPTEFVSAYAFEQRFEGTILDIAWHKSEGNSIVALAVEGKGISFLDAKEGYKKSSIYNEQYKDVASLDWVPGKKAGLTLVFSCFDGSVFFLLYACGETRRYVDNSAKKYVTKVRYCAACDRLAFAHKWGGISMGIVPVLHKEDASHAHPPCSRLDAIENNNRLSKKAGESCAKVSDMAFSPDGQYLAAAYSDKQLTIYETVPDSSIHAKYTLNKSVVAIRWGFEKSVGHRFAFADDHRSVCTGGVDQTLSKAILSSVRGEDEVFLAWQPGKKRLAIFCRDCVYLWDEERKKKTVKLKWPKPVFLPHECNKRSCEKLCWHPDGNELAVVVFDMLYIWDMKLLP